jgi:excisionase family DNA binding protein
MNEEYFLTVPEVAGRTGLSTKTIYKYIKLGYLKAEVLGLRKIVVTIDALDSLYRPYLGGRRRY